MAIFHSCAKLPKERIKTESTRPSHRPEPFPDLCSQNSTSAVWHSETSRATSSLVGKGARNFFKTNKSLELITGYYANTTSPRSRSPNHCVASLRPKKILSLFCSKNTCFSGKISPPSIPRGYPLEHSTFQLLPRALESLRQNPLCSSGIFGVTALPWTWIQSPNFPSGCCVSTNMLILYIMYICII